MRLDPCPRLSKFSDINEFFTSAFRQLNVLFGATATVSPSGMEPIHLLGFARSFRTE